MELDIPSEARLLDLGGGRVDVRVHCNKW